MKIGIIGLRHLHPRQYARIFAVTPGVTLTAAADSDEEILREFCGEFACKGYPDWRELLSRSDTDAVVIFLPHAECPEAACRAAEAGKHLMVEKPMAADVAGARRIVEAAREHGVKLSVPLVWRYHPAVLRIRDLIENDVLGRITAVEGRCAAGRPARYLEGNSSWMVDRKQSGGGAMWNLGIHWIDLFLWLLKDDVANVSGEIACNTAGMDIEDSSVGLVRFEGGAIGIIDISYSVPPSYPHGRDLYIGMRGTRGTVQWEPAYGGEADELFICSDSPTFGMKSPAVEKFSVPVREGYPLGHEYVADFARAVENDGPVPIEGADCVKALEIAEAVYKSAQRRPK